MSNGRAKIAPGEATINLGGVPEPAAEQLYAMRSEPFVYHARGGKLNKVASDETEVPQPPGQPDSYTGHSDYWAIR